MTNKNVDPSYLACPIRQVISRFGDKWSMLVLYSLHNSETGVLRFSELHKHMTDCSQKMLSSTLKSLMPAISSLIDWANLHFDDVVTKQIL